MSESKAMRRSEGDRSESDSLVIAIDIGNTESLFGVFAGDRLVDTFRLSTNPTRTTDELVALVSQLVHDGGIVERGQGVEGVIIGSVVPTIHERLDQMSRKCFGREPIFIEPGIRTGIPIRNVNPVEVGADRIVNAVAAVEQYGAPVVVADFGTATTFDVINARGEYVGGLIMPGIGISAEALFSAASRLYRVDIRRPGHLIGRTTMEAMQSGIYYGAIGQVDGVLQRLIEDLGERPALVATGGLAPLIASESQFLDEVNPDLTLQGLRLIYERNRASAG